MYEWKYPDNKKTIVFDIDETILFTPNGRDYENSYPNEPIVEAMRQLRKDGWCIILMTARGMGRSEGNIELVREEVTQEIETFCEKYDVPYDMLQLGKPWAAYYVDDKAITPERFLAKFIHGEI